MEGTASNLPSRSEEFEMRLTGRVVEPLSSPFFRPKTFDKKEGIAACPVVIDLRENGPRLGIRLGTRFLRLAYYGGEEELTGREAWEKDKLRWMDDVSVRALLRRWDVRVTEGEKEGS